MRCGAHLRAYNAWHTTRPWQAAVVVDAGFTGRNYILIHFFTFRRTIEWTFSENSMLFSDLYSPLPRIFLGWGDKGGMGE
jgi:hypothetical protein